MSTNRNNELFLKEGKELVSIMFEELKYFQHRYDLDDEIMVSLINIIKDKFS